MKPVSGHLEIMDRGFGFLRNIEHNFAPQPADTFVPAAMINSHNLREGLFIEGSGVKGNGKNNNLKLHHIATLNGLSPAAYAAVKPLQSGVSINPSNRFILTQNDKDLMGKALDAIVPMGRGQRGLIIAPPKTGKTTILQHMANAIITNHADVAIFVLLVDERPEEVTDFKRGIHQARVLASSADQSIAQHMRMTRLAMNTAIRCTEAGRDVVVLIDSLTRMARAFNTETPSHGRTMTGGLGANALEIPRQIFGAARNLEGGGSLTIMATILIDTGSRMDDIIYQEFKGTGNLDLVLSRPCAERRVWPAIDIKASGTRKEELLLNKADYKVAIDIRRALAKLDTVGAMEALLTHLKG
ncbi:MAG: transcription termination factor Rho [Desulfatitalea sp.]|nr:transcription termination factor Rho [Desulfatitalea sp.]NNK01310.1 transcription termination factor Rho [Desulfatitalea sp.]